MREYYSLLSAHSVSLSQVLPSSLLQNKIKTMKETVARAVADFFHVYHRVMNYLEGPRVNSALSFLGGADIGAALTFI
jgi:hypothetical protein